MLNNAIRYTMVHTFKCHVAITSLSTRLSLVRESDVISKLIRMHILRCRYTPTRVISAGVRGSDLKAKLEFPDT